MKLAVIQHRGAASSELYVSMHLRAESSGSRKTIRYGHLGHQTTPNVYTFINRLFLCRWSFAKWRRRRCIIEFHWSEHGLSIVPSTYSLARVHSINQVVHFSSRWWINVLLFVAKTHFRIHQIAYNWLTSENRTPSSQANNNNAPIQLK